MTLWREENMTDAGRGISHIYPCEVKCNVVYPHIIYLKLKLRVSGKSFQHYEQEIRQFRENEVSSHLFNLLGSDIGKHALHIPMTWTYVLSCGEVVFLTSADWKNC